MILTENLGFGLGPVGTFNFGSCAPGTLAAIPAPVCGTRYINPITRDYQIDPATKQLAQMPHARQLVLLAVMTIKGSSSALPWIGLEAPTVLSDQFESDLRAKYFEALSHLTSGDTPIIIVENIQIEIYEIGKVAATISFIDLQTGLRDTLET